MSASVFGRHFSFFEKDDFEWRFLDWNPLFLREYVQWSFRCRNLLCGFSRAMGNVTGRLLVGAWGALAEGIKALEDERSTVIREEDDLCLSVLTP